ncbi:hypothetical protein Tco_1072369, partial [Tanacetum coccineum]
MFSGYNNGENEFYNQTDIIEINAPYILSLEIELNLFLWKLLLLNVSLVEAFLDYSKGGYYATTSKQEKEEMLNRFILKLRHIKKLTIRISCAGTLSRLEAKGLTLPPNLKVLDVTSLEYGDGSLEVICEPSDSESNVSRDWEEPLLDESSEVDELSETDSYKDRDWEEEGSEIDEFDSDSDENGDTEEPLLDESSEFDEMSDNNSVENGDWDDPLLNEGAEVDDLSYSCVSSSFDIEVIHASIQSHCYDMGSGRQKNGVVLCPSRKKLNIKERIDIVLSWPSEEAPPVIEGSLDANEDIGVVEVSSAINDVFDIGESNVESMEVLSKFSEFSKNKESVEEVGCFSEVGIDKQIKAIAINGVSLLVVIFVLLKVDPTEACDPCVAAFKVDPAEACDPCVEASFP